MIPWGKILNAVCEHFSVTPLALCSVRRTRHLSRARMVYLCLVYEYTEFTLTETAATIGHQREAAGYAVRRVLSDHGLRADCNAIAPKLRAKKPKPHSLTSGPVYQSPPDSPRCVLATDGESHFVACFDGTWINAHTEEPVDSVVLAWQELTSAEQLLEYLQA